MTEQELKESIQYEDEDLIVLHKKPGIAVQTKQTGKQDLVSLLKNYRAEKGETPYIAPINRLDQPVEGLVLFAKNEKAAANLSGQLARGEMEKWYLAVLMDQNLPEKGHLRDYIKKDASTNLSKIVPEGTKGAKEALLDFRKIKTDGDLALVEIRLLTGRHHQIRAQMAFHGWPLLGDRKYGIMQDQDALPLALCAYRLRFRHPLSGARQDYETTPKGAWFERLITEREEVCK
ncbi:MAG: RNA pseudouridine synthase [Lachnospiraceae bacterium]|nr:RNA pseudouridine synthase [Lachnospiraceae bacterium]